MVRRNIVPSVHLGWSPPSISRRNARRDAAAFDWSRPVSNGRVTSRRASLEREPALWISVPLIALGGWALTVLLLL